MALSSSFTWYGLIKNGDLSVTSISTSMFGHVPISSLRLNASLYLYNISITFTFSSLFRHEVLKSMYFSNISLSVMFLLSSSGSNHGYLSIELVCSLSLFNVSTQFVIIFTEFPCFFKPIIPT